MSGSTSEATRGLTCGSLGNVVDRIEVYVVMVAGDNLCLS